MVAVVSIEIVVLLREIGDEEAEAAAPIVIADGDAHAALLGSVLAHGDAHRKRDVLERAVFLILIQEIRRRIVGHVQIGPPVGVVVEPRDAEPEVRARIGDARLRADLGEAAVAVVVKQQVGLALQAARTALDGNAAILAGLVLAEFRQMIEIDLHVAADEEIEISVVIVVGEAAPGRPAAARQARARGDVGEGAVVVVAIQVIAADGRDVEVLPAIAVQVSDRHGFGRLGRRQTDVKNVSSPLPDHWVIVGHEAEKFHLLRELSQPGGLGNIRRANHAGNFSFPSTKPSFQVGEVVAAKVFLFDGNLRTGRPLQSRQPSPERLIYG